MKEQKILGFNTVLNDQTSEKSNYRKTSRLEWSKMENVVGFR